MENQECPSKSSAARYSNGVQMMFVAARSDEEACSDLRRAAREVGLFKMEVECRTVDVGRRKVKAWRVAGTPEFEVHARIVARLAEEFSRVGL